MLQTKNITTLVRINKVSLGLLNSIQKFDFSLFSKLNQQAVTDDSQPIEWKKDVVVMPVKTTIEDLKNTHRLVKDGFYVSHRIYVEKMPEKYTTEPIPTRRTGGYDIETKEKLFRRVGGGLPIYWHFVDFKRVGPKSGPPLVEKVIDIIATRDRTSYLALVAHGDIKRYILATQNMKVGDLIRTSGEIPRVPVKAYEGDAYPCGALPMSTIVHNIEPTPGFGAVYCRAAGSSAEIVNQIGDRVIIKLPSGLELSLDKYCMVTVGQVSHATHKDEKLTHPVDTRDLGYRPRSGLWQRKDGYCGRKIHPPKPVKVVGQLVKEEDRKIKYTFNNWSLTD
ncbi:unnamed protein product [Brachionus calyciflorus]|uniref:39S ribosomal protein L2, mitochondrial n=1 Tax=Brachionus calyciflorus TaxID=104777 RepID=A0A813VIC3_9BILA|nr:unnamed protein product [Brachionus calyciflorus]